MNLYDEFYPLAVEMLDEFGADATLTATAPTASALAAKRAGRALPVTGTPSARSVRASVGPIQMLGADGRLETRSIAMTLDEPLPGEKLTMGATTWIVGAVTRLAPQGLPIIFTAEVS